ncbi:MAG: hypothetical protein HYW86_05470 [Candidatus Roizmanbacteria bacterium]|nr:MAG: hypothetical protein HYW86_05470 [Candidatus Roizmanbacteria bacterium]
MYTEILHSILITAALALSFLISKTSLAVYDLQISAFLFIVFFIGKKWLDKGQHKLIESLVFAFIINMIVSTTGAAQSPYFFLYYFLLFSLSLFLEPVIAITATIAVIFFSLLSLSQIQTLDQVLPILSLALITPFALFLGEEHIKNQISNVKLQNLEKDSYFFLSLVLKNHINNINQAAENFLGDRELEEIKKNVKRIKKLIEEYEK